MSLKMICALLALVALVVAEDQFAEFTPYDTTKGFMYVMNVRFKRNSDPGDLEDCFTIANDADQFSAGDIVKIVGIGSEAKPNSGLGEAGPGSNMGIQLRNGGASLRSVTQNGYAGVPFLVYQFVAAPAGSVDVCGQFGNSITANTEFEISLQLSRSAVRAATGVAATATDLSNTVETTDWGNSLAPTDLTSSWQAVKWIAQHKSKAVHTSGVGDPLSIYFQMPKTTGALFSLITANVRVTPSTAANIEDSFSAPLTATDGYNAAVALFSGANAAAAQNSISNAAHVIDWPFNLRPVTQYAQEDKYGGTTFNVPRETALSDSDARILGHKDQNTAGETCYKLFAYLTDVPAGSTANIAVDIFISGFTDVNGATQTVNVCHANILFGTTCTGETALNDRAVSLQRTLNVCPDTSAQTPFSILAPKTGSTNTWTNLWPGGKIMFSTPLSVGANTFDHVFGTGFDLSGGKASLLQASAVAPTSTNNIPLAKKQSMRVEVYLDKKADGAPAPNDPLTVTLSLTQNNVAAGAVTGTTTNGVFTFTGIVPGKGYRMEVTDAAYQGKTYGRAGTGSTFQFVSIGGDAVRPRWCDTATCNGKTITSDLTGAQPAQIAYLYRAVEVIINNFIDENSDGVLGATEVLNTLTTITATSAWSFQAPAAFTALGSLTGQMRVAEFNGPYTNVAFQATVVGGTATNPVVFTQVPTPGTAGTLSVFVPRAADPKIADFATTTFESPTFEATSPTPFTFHAGVQRLKTVTVNLITDFNADGLINGADAGTNGPADFTAGQPTGKLVNRNTNKEVALTFNNVAAGASLSVSNVQPGPYTVFVTLPASHELSPKTTANKFEYQTGSTVIATYSFDVVSTGVENQAENMLINKLVILRIYAWLDLNADFSRAAADTVLPADGTTPQIKLELTTGAGRTPVDPTRFTILPPAADLAGVQFIPVRVKVGTQIEFVKLSDADGGRTLVSELMWRQDPTNENAPIETSNANVLDAADAVGAAADGLKTVLSGQVLKIRNAGAFNSHEFPFIPYVIFSGRVYEDMNGNGVMDAGEVAPLERAADRSQLSLSAVTQVNGVNVAFPSAVGLPAMPSQSWINADGSVRVVLLDRAVITDTWSVIVADARAADFYVGFGTTVKTVTKQLTTSPPAFGDLGFYKLKTIEIDLIDDINANGNIDAGEVGVNGPAQFTSGLPTGKVRNVLTGAFTAMTFNNLAAGATFVLNNFAPGDWEYQITLPFTHELSPQTATNPFVVTTAATNTATLAFSIQSNSVTPQVSKLLTSRPAVLKIYAWLDANADFTRTAPADTVLTADGTTPQIKVELTTGAGRTPVDPTRFTILAPAADLAGVQFIPVRVKVGTQIEFVKLSDAAGGRLLVPELLWRQDPTKENVFIETSNANVLDAADNVGAAADGLKTLVSGEVLKIRNTGTFNFYEFPFIPAVIFSGRVYEDMNGNGVMDAGEVAPLERAADLSQLSLSAVTQVNGVNVAFPFGAVGAPFNLPALPTQSWINDDGSVRIVLLDRAVNTDTWSVTVADARAVGNYVVSGTTAKTVTKQLTTSPPAFGDIGFYKLKNIELDIILDINANGFVEAGEVGVNGPAEFTAGTPTGKVRSRFTGTLTTLTYENLVGGARFTLTDFAPGDYEYQIALPTSHALSPFTATNPFVLSPGTNTGLSLFSLRSNTVSPLVSRVLISKPAILRVYAWLDLNADFVQTLPADVGLSATGLNPDIDLAITTGAARTPVDPTRYTILPPQTDAVGRPFIPVQLRAGTQFEFVKLSDATGGRPLVPEYLWRQDPTKENVPIETDRAFKMDGGGAFTIVANGLKTADSGEVFRLENPIPLTSPEFPFIPYAILTGRVYEDTNGNGMRDAGETGPSERAVDRSQLHLSAVTQVNGADVAFPAAAIGAPLNLPAMRSDSWINADGSVRIVILNRAANTDKWTVTVEDDRLANFYVLSGSNLKAVTRELSALPLAFGDIGVYKRIPFTLGAFRDANRDGIRGADESGIALSVLMTDTLERAVAKIGEVLLDDTGMATLQNVHPGVYTVQYPLLTNFVFAPVTGGGSNVDATGKLTVSVLSGGPSQPLAAIAGYQTPGLIENFFVWEDANGNGVFDIGENPLAVRALLLGPEGISREVLTSANGGVSFQDLPAGPYRIVVTPPSPSWRFSPPQQGSDNTKDSNADSVGVVLTAITSSTPKVANLAAGMFRLSTVEIDVFNDLNGNTRRDALEGGFSDHRVSLVNTRTGDVFAGVTDANGRIVFSEELPPGDYTGTAFLTSAQTIQPGGSIPTSGKFSLTVRSGAFPPRLVYGIVERVDQAVLIWHDINGDGQYGAEPGYQGATVELASPDGKVLTGKTDGAGRFTFMSLSPDERPYTFKLVSTGEERVTKIIDGSMVDAKGVRQVVIQSRTTPEEIKAGLFVLSGPIIAEIYGDKNGDGIRDGSDAPLEKLSMQLFLQGGGSGAVGAVGRKRDVDGVQQAFVPLGDPIVTDDQGKASFPNLVPGLYLLQITFGDDQQMSEKSSDNAFDIDGKAQFLIPSNTGPIVARGMVTLRTTLSGNVTNEFGRPVAGVSVAIWKNGTPVYIIPTDPYGGFSISPFPPGSYLVVFTPPNGKYVVIPTDGTSSVQVAPGDNKIVNARLGEYPSEVLGTAADLTDPAAVFVPTRLVARVPADSEANANTGPGVIARSSRHVYPITGTTTVGGYQLDDDYWSRSNFGADNVDSLVSPDIFAAHSSHIQPHLVVLVAAAAMSFLLA